MGPLNSENVLRMRESYSGAILFSPKADGLNKRGIWVPLVGGVKLGCAILQGVLSILLQTRTLHVALVPFYWAPKLGFRPGWSRLGISKSSPGNKTCRQIWDLCI